MKTWSDMSPRSQKLHGIVFLGLIAFFPAMFLFEGVRPPTPAEQADYDRRYAAARTEQLLEEAFARSNVARVCRDGSLVTKDAQTGRMFWLWKSYWGDRHEPMAADASITQVCEAAA